MRCPGCSAENPDNHRFCGSCGAALPEACPACGAPVAAGQAFCGACGTGLQPAEAPPQEEAAAGERRQVTVLFSDLASFTKISKSLDPEETHAMLDGYFGAVDGIVERYGGAIDKHIGDCVMAVFGAPVAHGDDPERALRAAFDIHAAMPELAKTLGREIAAHIGVASGQVVASGTGSDAHREYTVTGDSVNLASRLQDLAGPGETLLSDAVHSAVDGVIESEPVDDVSIEGFDRAIRIWRARVLAPGGKASAPRPFVGRRAERMQFEGVAEACRETGHGHAVHARGEAGIGKTRLVEEFRAAAERKGFACHTGLVLDFGVGKGQDAIRNIVRSLLGIPSGGGKAARTAAAEAALAAGDVEDAHTVFLNDLLDLPQPTALRAVYDAMDNETRNRGKRETVVGLVEQISSRQPLVIVAEDVHWADDITLAHLASLADAVANCRALLVMTSRIEGDPIDQAWRAASGGSPLMTVDLAPLRDDEAMALAGEYIDATNRLARNCVDRAGGNPLFLDQLLRNAEETEEDSVPGSVQSIVLARMDSLDPGDRQALQTASVLGQRFSPAALQHLIDDSNYGCAALIEHALVRPEGEDFLFAHALVQEGIYSSLLKPRRRELHRRAAEWYAANDPVLRAEHLDRADDPAAAAAYLVAAEGQAADYHYDRARQLAERGLKVAKAKDDRCALTLLLGRILHDLGSIPESIAAFESAREVAEDDVDLCRAWLGFTAGMRIADRLDEAFAALDEAQAIAEKAKLVELLADIHHLRGNLYFPLGRVEECGAEHARALEYAEKSNSPEIEASALGGMGDAEYARGHMRTAHDHFRRCVELARAHGLGQIEVAHLGMVAHTACYFLPQDQVMKLAEEASEAAARVGHHRAELNARSGLFLPFLELGDAARAKVEAERTRTIIRRIGAWRFEPNALITLARIRFNEGDAAGARETLKEAMKIARKTGISFQGPRVLGFMAVAAEDAKARKKAIRDGEKILAQGSVGHSHLWFRRMAMEACLNAGEWDEAERHAQALDDYTRAVPLAWSDFFIAHSRALAAHGRGERGKKLLAEIKRVRKEGEHLGFLTSLPAIDAALGEA